MNNVKFFFKNYAFMLKKCNACTIILLVVALIISISFNRICFERRRGSMGQILKNKNF